VKGVDLDRLLFAVRESKIKGLVAGLGGKSSKKREGGRRLDEGEQRSQIEKHSKQ